MTPQSKAEAIGKWGCLAFCYLFCAGYRDVSEGQLMKMVSDAMDQGLLDEECTVLSAAKFLNFFTGKKYFVDKQPITTIENIKEATPVLYYNERTGKGHFVVVEDGKVVYNSLKRSISVEEGKPTSARFITLM